MQRALNMEKVKLLAIDYAEFYKEGFLDAAAGENFDRYMPDAQGGAS